MLPATFFPLAAFFSSYFTDNQQIFCFQIDCKCFVVQTNIEKIIKGSCSQYYRSDMKSSNVNSMQP